LVNKKTLIALLLSLILILPLSAFAESFTVTTNKDIYSLDENAIIVGVIPEDAPDGYAVLIKVTGSSGDCTSQNILPGADNSFRSKLVKLDQCGFGQFTVSAFYADFKTNSTFTISNSSKADTGSKLELSALRNVMLQALDVVNTRVKELIEGGYVLPENVANKYSEGVSEASLALQAIDFGDAAEAKKHMIFAIQDFRQVLKELSGENVAKFEQAANNAKSEVVGTYNILQRKYYKLQGVAETNQVDRENQFNAALLLLSNAKRSIDDGNYEDAERRLGQVNAILEKIRADLYEEEEEEEKFASDSDGTRQTYEEEARRLTNAADIFQKKALELLNETGSDADAEAKLQEALSLIAGARASIEAQDLDSARYTLTTANKIIKEARELIEDDEDTSTPGGAENSDDGNSESSSDDEDSNNGNSSEDKEDDKDTKGSDDDEEDH
jgi:flagellin-specific chaperone FliS